MKINTKEEINMVGTLRFRDEKERAWKVFRKERGRESADDVQKEGVREKRAQFKGKEAEMVGGGWTNYTSTRGP